MDLTSTCPFQTVGNFDTSGMQRIHRKTSTSLGLQASSVLMSVTLKDDVRHILNWNASLHEPIHLAAGMSTHGLIPPFIFSFPCCHFPHVSCRRRLDGLNVWKRLVLTSASRQDSPYRSGGPSLLKLGAQFSLWRSVGYSFYFDTSIMSYFPSWLRL